jgi:ferredoxin-type protein NapH
VEKDKLRKVVQTVFFGVWILLILLLISGLVNTCHQFCPYAVVCYGTMTVNGYVAYLPMVIIGLLTAISVIFLGRMFCGYVCFLGTIQEFVFKLNKTKNKFQQRIPYKYHRYLLGIKYIVLLITVVSAYLGIQYYYMKFCPVVALSHPQNIGIAAAFTLAVILLGGYFVERFWCRYLCPYAALMNIFQRLGKLLKIKKSNIYRNVKTSINCFNCANYCPLNVDIGYNEEISDVNCIHCYRCVRKCSIKDAAKSGCIYRD